MDFSEKKLGPEASMHLVRVSMDRVRPHMLMGATAYVWMQRNQKFISVKRPLDFFNESEFNKLRTFGDLYFPKSIERVQNAQDWGYAVKALLHFKPRTVQGMEMDPLATFELNDAIVRTMTQLWDTECNLDPYYLCFFVDQVCGPLDPGGLESMRDFDTVGFEQALFQSSWAVTLALLLGYSNTDWLRRFRKEVFSSQELRNPDLIDLAALVRKTLPNTETKRLSCDLFDESVGRMAERLKSRLHRIRSEKGSANG